jgi:AraC family transcriptional regulator
MPRRKEISHPLNSDLISMQVFPADFDFMKFDIDKPFEKWAAVVVSEDVEPPADLYRFTLEAGTYAVFLHKGPASTGEKTFRFIFEEWLPSSGFVIDQRPHFEVLGSKYKNEDPDSEEEIWIPIKNK